MKKDNMVLDAMKWLFQPFDWPADVRDEYKNWYIIKKMCKEPAVQSMFKQHKPEIRFDKRYKLYTVINIPTELYDKQHDSSRETFLIDELRKIEATTLKLGVSEILYPEYTIITDIPESYAYLLTMDTDRESMKLMPMLKWLFKAFLWFLMITAFNAIIANITGNSIIGWISQLFN